MLARCINRSLVAVVGFLAVATAFAQSASQSPPAQSQVGGSVQASGQGAVDVGRSGAAAQGSGTSEAAAHAGDDHAQLAGDSSVNAVLTKPVDSRKCKPGDPVNARTTEPARTSDGRSIPQGSALVGHVSEVHTRGEGGASSSLGIVFDKAETKDGREIPLRNVGIRALAAAEGAASGSAGESGMMMGPGGMGGGGMAAGRGGGGLVGRTTGAVGATVGGGLEAAGGVAGSVGGGAGSALQAGRGAVGGLNGSGLLAAGSSGVFGMRDVSLAGSGSGASQGSVVASTGKSVRLDQGTRLLLSSQANNSGRGDHESGGAKPSASPSKGSQPDRR